MTIQEQKLEIIKRGFILSERILPTDTRLIQVVVFKVDTDGLKYESAPNMFAEEYNNEETYVSVLKVGMTGIDAYITKRHAQNPNTCRHEEVDLEGGALGCLHCMAKLGTRTKTKTSVIDIKLGNN